MKRYSLVIMLLLCVLTLLAAPSTQTVLRLEEEGVYTETVTAPGSALHPASGPAALGSEVLWHYQIPDGGPQRLNTSLGYNDQWAWSGGFYGGGKMFAMDGDGTPEWEYVNDSYALGDYGTAAAKTADIFYGVWAHDGQFEVSRFSSSSSTPIWTWDGAAAGYQPSDITQPGRIACSDDGSILVVGGNNGTSLAVMIFSADSPEPLIYVNDDVAYNPRQVRLTADGSKVLLRAAAVLYRVDTATATLEASYNLGASTDCFGVSPDGSVVTFGFGNMQVIEWDGSAYQHVFTGYRPPGSGAYAGRGYVGADNDQVIIVWYAPSYLQNWVARYSKAQGSEPIWTYETNLASGSNQDTPAWIDVSADGEWIAIAFWGSSNKANDEIIVLRDSNPVSPWWGLPTPGSATDVRISDDGRYLVTAGKHVHMNTMGSGGDVFAAEIDQTTGLLGGEFLARWVTEGVLLEWDVEGSCEVRLEREGRLLAEGLAERGGWLDRDISTDTVTYRLLAYGAGGEAAIFGPVEVQPRPPVGVTLLERPYPNPSAGEFRLAYELATGSEVELSLYDLAGRRLRLLESGYRVAGRHPLSVDVSELPNGVYIISLRTAEGRSEQRLIVDR